MAGTRDQSSHPPKGFQLERKTLEMQNPFTKEDPGSDVTDILGDHFAQKSHEFTMNFRGKRTKKTPVTIPKVPTFSKRNKTMAWKMTPFLFCFFCRIFSGVFKSLLNYEGFPGSPHHRITTSGAYHRWCHLGGHDVFCFFNKWNEVGTQHQLRLEEWSPFVYIYIYIYT